MSQEIMYLRIKAILSQYEGLELHDKRKGTGNFRFPVYLKEKYKEVDIEDLDLTVRAKNCLKRAGISTVYDLMTKITGRADLDRIRSCGMDTSRAIMEALFVYQYCDLTAGQKENYIKRIAEMNR